MDRKRVAMVISAATTEAVPSLLNILVIAKDRVIENKLAKIMFIVIRRRFIISYPMKIFPIKRSIRFMATWKIKKDKTKLPIMVADLFGVLTALEITFFFFNSINSVPIDDELRIMK